jgi:hypothetical protein
MTRYTVWATRMVGYCRVVTADSAEGAMEKAARLTGTDYNGAGVECEPFPTNMRGWRRGGESFTINTADARKEATHE